MVRTIITPTEHDELKRLYAEFAAATERAATVLATKGVESPEFAEADKAAGVLSRRIREILGTADKHWMA